MALAHDTGQPEDLRVAALSAAARRGATLDGQSFELLLSQFNEQAPPLARLTAATALASARLSVPQLAALSETIARSGPLELPVLIGAFERSADAATGLTLVSALEKSPGLTSLPEPRLRQLLRPFPAEVQSAAEPLLSKLNVDLAQQREALARLESQLEGGDPARGRDVFASKKTACIACHRITGVGETIGPDLTRIGQARTRRDLLEAIVFPSLSFARGYESYTIQTDAGLTHTGVVGRETVDAIYLRTPERAEIRIDRGSIEQMAPSRVSVMPQGLDKTMTPAELRDLVAYLLTLK
jgi:putative heme-binding domain-containing protein